MFNVEQTENITYTEIQAETNTLSPIEAAEQIISTMPNKPLIQHKGNRAYFNPLSDTVTLPQQTAFQSPEEYSSITMSEPKKCPVKGFLCSRQAHMSHQSQRSKLRGIRPGEINNNACTIRDSRIGYAT